MRRILRVERKTLLLVLATALFAILIALSRHLASLDVKVGYRIQGKASRADGLVVTTFSELTADAVEGAAFTAGDLRCIVGEACGSLADCEDEPEAAVSLAPGELRKLRSRAIARLKQDPKAWRPVLARMLCRLARSAARPAAVAIDIRFEEPSGETAAFEEAQLARLADAIRFATAKDANGKSRFEVVVSVLDMEPPPALMAAGVRIAKAVAEAEPVWGVIRSVPVFAPFETEQGEIVRLPTLPVETVCASHGLPFGFSPEERPMCLPRVELLDRVSFLLRAGEERIPLLSPKARFPEAGLTELLTWKVNERTAKLKDKILIVGFELGDSEDLHTPFLEDSRYVKVVKSRKVVEGREVVENRERQFGVWFVAAALSQLLSHSVPPVASRFGVLGVVWFLAAMPFLLLSRVRFPRVEGVSLLAAALALAYLAVHGVVAPFASAALVVLGTVAVLGAPRLSLRLTAARFVRSARAASALFVREGYPEISKIPVEGPTRFVGDLSVPLLDFETFEHWLRDIYINFIESKGTHTYFEAVPFAYFAQGPGKPFLEEGGSGKKAVGCPYPVLERSDCLTEAFIGNRIRRIRHLVAHEKNLSLHAVRLGYQAIEALLGRRAPWHWWRRKVELNRTTSSYMRLHPSEYALLQRVILMDLAAYFESLREYSYCYSRTHGDSNEAD